MSDMEQIFSKKLKPKQISLLEAAKMMEAGETPFVLFPTDGDCAVYERQDLDEFLEDCVICIDR